ncbi:MAG: hypothetical protein U1F57_03140 [bacterium]
MSSVSASVSNPAPDYGMNPYDTAGYAGTAPSYGRYDASYGSGDSTQAYIQYMHRYEAMLLSYRQTHLNDPQALATIDSYLATAHQYLQQMGDDSSSWDPLGGLMGGGLGMGNAPMDQTGEVIWGDNTRIKYDGTDGADVTVRLHDGDSREKDFFQDDLTLRIPFHANGQLELLADDSLPAPAKMLKITVNLPDGSRRVFVKHDFKETSNIRILTPDGDSKPFTPDTALASSPLSQKVNFGNLTDETSATTPQGDPPTKMEGNTRVYDGKDFDISPVPSGSGKKTRVKANGEVTITPTSNDEYFRMDYEKGPPSKYVLKVYANDEDYKNNKVKETIDIDGALVKKLHFAGDKSRIDFGNLSKGTPPSLSGKGRAPDAVAKKAVFGTSATSPSAPAGAGSTAPSTTPPTGVPAPEKSNPSHELDPSKPGATKVDVVGDSNGKGAGGPDAPVNPQSKDDNIPDALENDVAIYDGSNGQDSTNVSLHTYFDDPLTVREHDIFTSGEVTIFASSFRDVVNVTKDEKGRYKVEVLKNGDPKKTVTYFITGDAKKIKIKGALPSQVNNSAKKAWSETKYVLGADFPNLPERQEVWHEDPDPKVEVE